MTATRHQYHADSRYPHDSVAQPRRLSNQGVPQTDPITGFTVTRTADKSELVGDYGGYKSSLSAIVYFPSPNQHVGEFVLVHGDNSTSAWIYRVADNKMMTILKLKPTMRPNRRLALSVKVNELRWDTVAPILPPRGPDRPVVALIAGRRWRKARHDLLLH